MKGLARCNFFLNLKIIVISYSKPQTFEYVWRVYWPRYQLHDSIAQRFTSSFQNLRIFVNIVQSWIIFIPSKYFMWLFFLIYCRKKGILFFDTLLHFDWFYLVHKYSSIMIIRTTKYIFSWIFPDKKNRNKK